MAEINLLDLYPRPQRPIEERGRRKLSKEGWIGPLVDQQDNVGILLEHRLLEVARQFGKEYFDGDRLYGYGGYYYDPRFWTDTVRKLKEHYKLPGNASILDVGCAKGFMLYDFKKLMPQAKVAGLDISEYARGQASEGIRPFISVGNAKSLPYPDASFDLVLSISTVDHLPLKECEQAIREIQRVGRGKTFISVNAWRDDEERDLLLKWNITAQTSMHVDDWKRLFKRVGYEGDYWWFLVKP